MNNITVFDVLGLPIMSNARLKAGHGGLKNTIQYVNILDNRYDDTDTSAHIPKYGENFYITSMYYGKKDAAYTLSVIHHFIEVNAAAVCIIDEYIDDLPQEACDLADSHNLPIIFVNKETPYPIIISSIMELKLSYQQSHWNENLLLSLTRSDCSEETKREIIKEINPSFSSNLIAFHCAHTAFSQKEVTLISNELKLISQINSQTTSFASSYGNGILIIHSFKNSSAESVDDIIQSVVKIIRPLLRHSVIGISQIHPLMDLGKAILESKTASNSGSYDAKGIVHFQRLGALQLIMELYGRPELDKYYREIQNPIKAYDEKYNSYLMDTVISYIENNMDYVKTSKAIFVHENTVRYRLNKVKSLIPYGSSDMDFQQTLYLFYKIMKLKEFN